MLVHCPSLIVTNSSPPFLGIHFNSLVMPMDHMGPWWPWWGNPHPQHADAFAKRRLRCTLWTSWGLKWTRLKWTRIYSTVTSDICYSKYVNSQNRDLALAFLSILDSHPWFPFQNFAGNTFSKVASTGWLWPFKQHWTQTVTTTWSIVMWHPWNRNEPDIDHIAMRHCMPLSCNYADSIRFTTKIWHFFAHTV